MKKRKIIKTSIDSTIKELASRADHRTLAIWAADCAERVLPLFEELCPEDHRPRNAIEALRLWTRTGVFKMVDVRGTSLAAHAAGREIEGHDAARSAARAAGQAMATAHVPQHAMAAAIYAATAVRDATSSPDANNAAVEERDWQYRHLLELLESSGCERS